MLDVLNPTSPALRSTECLRRVESLQFACRSLQWADFGQSASTGRKVLNVSKTCPWTFLVLSFILSASGSLPAKPFSLTTTAATSRLASSVCHPCAHGNLERSNGCGRGDLDHSLAAWPLKLGPSSTFFFASLPCTSDGSMVTDFDEFKSRAVLSIDDNHHFGEGVAAS